MAGAGYAAFEGRNMYHMVVLTVVVEETVEAGDEDHEVAQVGGG